MIFASAASFSTGLRPGAGVRRLYARIRELVPALDGDRPVAPDIERVALAVAREALI